MILNKTVDMSEVARCLLCHEPACTKACPKGISVGDIIRSLYFDNIDGAVLKMSESCNNCDAPCERACVKGKKSHSVAIKNVMTALEKDAKNEKIISYKNIDLSASICGVKLENPFLLSSSVVASNYEMCAKALKMGWAGIVFKTIQDFEQNDCSPRFSATKKQNGSFYGFKNIEELSHNTVEEDMKILSQLKKDFPTKIIVASIMGRNEEEWTSIAKACEQAGVDVIECNFSCPNLENSDIGITIGQDEELIERFTRATKKGTKLPVLAKMTPNVADMVPFARAAKRGGADGIAAINTIRSITGVDLKECVAEPAVNGRSMIGGYSGVAVKPIALRFICDMANDSELELPISGMGGIETWHDGLEFLLLGAESLQVTTSVMEYGYRVIEDMLDGLKRYMGEKGIQRVSDLIGGAKNTVVAPPEVERFTCLFPAFDLEKCVGCGRCYISCYDGGHQAIDFDTSTKIPKLNGSKCVGCHLCKLVCPSNAIGTVEQRIKIPANKKN
ncbi:NAD-dependent dihydropyrimidine dehydrogenase subunit PreA [Clostridium sp. MD294]|uniref:NAD-dependent dihydropyrimidine dehydrogenase subunit PreA n=1 Tax=Clostridium sp. MD294 TaxID=97138 RepID=UPI0002C9198F|nr:NAD-dependent dihydropyrimidine dehydrogenase subunit PreA [Clostridium sp. MD294]NDO45401.1 NAD-dependent dihydropyrimidine dehydrogenase subunit PreA [Clostridium sp. MD294]USF30954.1 Dihydroorotate dehydrogenase [Clostridium sp. MD294]